VEASQEDYNEITVAVGNLPKKVQEKIKDGSYKIATVSNHLCVNIPLFELEKLYTRINELSNAVKKQRKKRK